MNIYNMNKETEMLITKKLENIKKKNKKESIQNLKRKIFISQDSLGNSNNNSIDRIKKVRSRKRFQTEFNKNAIIFNKDSIEKKNAEKLGAYEDKNSRIKLPSSKDLVTRNNKAKPN